MYTVGYEKIFPFNGTFGNLIFYQLTCLQNYLPIPHAYFQTVSVCVQNLHFKRPFAYYAGIMLNGLMLLVCHSIMPKIMLA